MKLSDQKAKQRPYHNKLGRYRENPGVIFEKVATWVAPIEKNQKSYTACILILLTEDSDLEPHHLNLRN